MQNGYKRFKFSSSDTNSLSIAIDSNNVPYIAYQDIGNENRLIVSKYNGISWEFVGNPSFSAGEATYISMAIDKNDIPYVVFVGNPGFSPSSASDITIALDNNNIPYIAYHDVSKNVIVMKFTGTNWETLGRPLSGQQQSVHELILRILADQALMNRCLRIFFCETLQEISSDNCLSPERKMNIAKELFSAAAQKESSLAAVIEAASKF